MKSIQIQTTQTKGNDEVIALNVVQGMNKIHTHGENQT
jgi:hypothetical protein